jgi:hypothetical protein
MKPSKRPPFDFTAGAEPSAGPPTVEEAPVTFGKAPKPVREPAGWPIYLAAFVVSVLWAGAPIAYAVGFQRGVSPLNYEPFALAVFALLAIGPIALIWIAAYALRQGMKLAAEVRRTRVLAAEMLAPAGMAAAEAGSVVEAVRLQIDEAAASARRAGEVMTSLRDTLVAETGRLDETSAASVRSATQVAETLGAERERLNGLSTALEAQALAISTGSALAAEVTKAASEATDAARTAGEDLARHTLRLESAGSGVSEQMRTVEQELASQRAALLELAETLRTDQQALGVDVEARTTRLSELVTQSRSATAEVGEAAQSGAEAIQHLTAAAAERFNELGEAAKRERDTLTEAMRGSLDQITAAAEEARKAADAHAEAAQARVDQLNEAAFEAGRKADAVFEARLTQAKGLVEESAQLVDTAGENARQRLEGWIAAARATLSEVERLLADISTRAEALPAEAERRAKTLQASMEQNLGALVASAHKASEETKALDASFQQRVRTNYEMLSEAVRLMGLVAGEPGAAKPAAVAAAQPAPAPKPAEPAAGGLRRLRLTPVATDTEFNDALQTASTKAPLPPEEDGLGWKGLLESLDRDGADPEHLSQKMVAEIRGMGVDPAAVLPQGKIEAIAAAVQTGDAAGAREVVRATAATATGRLARRLFADAALRGQAERYRRRFSGMLQDAAERDHQGFLVGSLLASDEGRAYLLLDAAATNPA